MEFTIPFQHISIDELYSKNFAFGPFALEGIVRGITLVPYNPQYLEYASVEREYYQKINQPEKLRKSIERVNRLKLCECSYQGPIYYGMLEEAHVDDLLPLLALEFDERIHSLLKTSSEMYTTVIVRGFFAGKKKNETFGPLILEEIEMHNRVFKRKS